MKHIIDLNDISIEKFSELYNLACDIMENEENYLDALKGKILASLFFEPSTRTNLSFQTAMMKLGGQVIGFTDPNSSSSAKGESLKDTIKTVSQYADVIVMRNPFEGSSKAASMFSNKPLINAGDGGHLHPTQTISDLITIKKYRGSLNNMTIGLCGDLKYGRTVHSLIKSLAKYDGVNFVLISPKELVVPSYIVKFMDDNNLNYRFATSLEEEIPNLDILYMTRIQRERFDDINEYYRLKNVYILTKEKLQAAKSDLIVLHPLPRVDEISNDVDEDPRALYFEQARCGMYGRMALILMLIREFECEDANLSSISTEKVCSNQKCITKTETYLPIKNEETCFYCDKSMD